MIPDFKTFIEESLWSEIQDRSSGDAIRKEDDVNLLDLDEFYEYIKEHYKANVKYYAMGGGSGAAISVDITEDILLLYKPKRGHILLSWTETKIPMSFFDELEDRFKIENTSTMRRIITEKDGSCTNKTFVNTIEFVLGHKESIMNESIWSDMQDRSTGDTVRKEDERHKILERLLATYIKLFAESRCNDEYIYNSYPYFISYIKDFRDNPRIEEVCPNNSYIDDLLDYVNVEIWDNQIYDIIEEISQRIVHGEHPITDDVIEELRKHNVNESIWSDMQDRSAGYGVREEDITEEDKKEIDYIFNGFAYLIVYTDYKPTIDDFIKMMKEAYPDKDSSKYIAWVRSKWDKKYKDELDKKIQRNKKDVDKRINIYLNNFVGQIVYCEKYNVSFSDIKKFSDEVLKHDGMLNEMSFVGKIRVNKSWCDIFKKYVDENWNDVKKRINDLIVEENQEIAKTGFKKTPGKKICDILDEWWDSLGDEKDDIAWNEFGERAEEKYYEEHNSKYNEYTGEDFDADEEWSDTSWIESVEIYMKYNQKTNESIWSDMQDRSMGDAIRKEDDLDAVDDFISRFAAGVVWDGIKVSLSNFLKYIDENPEYLDCDIKRVKKYVEDNWRKGICDDVEAAIEMEEREREEGMNESIWSDMQDRSTGDVVRKEDEMNDDDFFMLRKTAEMFRNFMKRNRYASRMNTCDNFIKYIERRKEEHFWTNVSDEAYDKVIRFVQKNWSDCTGIQEFMDKYLSNINECDGVPGGLTPADVGGMGPAYFPGPNGEPGSGDLPSPTGIVYKQVAPFDSFIKIRKQKKKKKKFRKEDELCVHSENPPIYSHVDDFRDYVDRTYNNIDKKNGK